jgi:phosphoenolpyruvate synthase/pyruvate phosphate dikinase
MTVSLPSILPLADISQAPAALVGGKARGLAAIAGAGLPTADGFVVTTAAYRAASAGRAPSGRLPAALEAAIADAVAVLGGDRLAVRSSATGEDGAHSSHAGQFCTVLGVRGALGAISAVAACWTSARAAEPAAYRRLRGLADPLEMAVIVQRLVEPEAAGVCFSADPVSGDPGTIVVNAAWGLGEPVVAGTITPDDYRLARADGRLLRFVPGRQEHMLVPTGDGVAEMPVPGHLREVRVLDEGTLALLHAGALLLEGRVGAPVDCEFCVAEGAVVWLQCRPMTACGAAGARAQARGCATG